MGAKISTVKTMEEMNHMEGLEVANRYVKTCSNFLLQSAAKVPVSDEAMIIYQTKFKDVIGLEVGQHVKVLTDKFPWRAAAAAGVHGVAAGAAALFIDAVMQEPDDMQKMKTAAMDCLTNVKHKELHDVVEAKLQELHTRVNHVSDKESTRKLIDIDSSMVEVLKTAKEFLQKDGTSWDMEEFKMFNVYRTATCIHLIAAELLYEKRELDAEGLSRSRQMRYSEMLDLVPRYVAFRQSKLYPKNTIGRGLLDNRGELIIAMEWFTTWAKGHGPDMEMIDSLTNRRLMNDSSGLRTSQEKAQAYSDYLSQDAWTLAVAINESLLLGKLK